MFIPFLPVTKTAKELNRDSKISVFHDLVFFEYGRQGMKVGLDLFKFDKDTVVLMPASLCPAVIEPFSNMGLKIKLYNLDKNLQWELSDIKKRITTNTVALYIIHYFGITYNLREIRDFCDENDIILIEDCALAGFDSCSTIGSFGDLVIFSLWKFHAMTDGAVLKINKHLTKGIKSKWPLPNWVSLAKRQIKIRLKALGTKNIVPISILKKLSNKNISIQDDAPRDNYGKSYPILSMSSQAKKFFLNENLEMASIQRRLNFNTMHQFCSDNNIHPLFDCIKDRSIPYCFPIIVNNPIELQSDMKREGIETELSINKPITCKSYLVKTEDSFMEVIYLADHVLSIPIHQNIGVNEVKHIKISLLKHHR
jgi:hypothetical protein